VIRKLKNSLILFPFIFSVYPVLALIAHNAAEMDLSQGIRALLASLVLTLLVYTVLLILIRRPIKTALITSLFMLLFYSYGHVNFLSRTWMIFGFSIGRHRSLIPLYIISFVLVAWLILRSDRDLTPLTRFLNAFGIVLLIFPIYQLATYQVNAYYAENERAEAVISNANVSLPENRAAPDIYYILVDGYPRSDFINQYFASDNTEFLENLEERGFYIAQCSQSNYTDTRFSMASTLNMVYLDDGKQLSEVVHPGSTLDSMIHSSTVQKNFTDLGYSIVTFESGYKWLRWENPDLHLDPALERSKRKFMNIGINDYEKLLLDTTAAKIIIDIPFVLNPEQAKKLEEIINSPRASHRDRVLYTLNTLPEIPETISGPKFIYAHIIFPHPPFIVDAEGNSLQNSPPDEVSAYADQITYLNTRLVEIVDTLIESSDPDPVIIIQSDHGATVDYEGLNIDKSQRLGILNAYYLPGNTVSELDPTITPVNTFRIIFDKLFNGNYGRIEDKSIIGRQSPFTTIDCTPIE
jgi:hypothetical protein